MQPVITLTIHEAGQIYAALSPSGLARLTPELRRKLKDPLEHVESIVKLATDTPPNE